MKWWIAAAFVLIPCAAVAQGPGKLHEVGPGSISYGASALLDFERRIETDAKGYIARYPNGSADRFVEFDATMPLDIAEYEAMGKYAVLMVAVFSQKAEELPLRAVRAGGVELRLIGQTPRTVSDGTAAARFFGANRIDAFYLVPAAAMKRGAALTADFARNRLDFTIGDLNAADAPDFIVNDRSDAPTHLPAPDALNAMIEREYPGFGIVVAP